MSNEWINVPSDQRRRIATFSPKVNWKVRAFQYLTFVVQEGQPETVRTNRIFLASNGCGVCRGVSWQSCAPYDGVTAYHGSWSELQANGGLTINFNAAGPDAGYLKSTHVMRIFPGNSYEGRDSSGRKVRLIADGCYQLRKIEEQEDHGSTVLSWCVLEEMPSREILEVD